MHDHTPQVHDGRHGGNPDAHRASRTSALRAVLAINAVFLAIEIVGGLAFHSLALLADGVHMVSDVVAITLALWATTLTTRAPTHRHTYGFGRAEILVAQGNAFMLLAASAWIVFEAVSRIGAAPKVEGAGVVLVAGLGLAANALSAGLLARHASGNLNMRSAFWHMASDALGCAAALGAGIAAWVWQLYWLDPVASLAVTVLVILAGWRVLADATRVLLEAAPGHVDRPQVVAAIEELPAVRAVHHMHLWSIGSGATALSAHVVLAEEQSLHDAQLVAADIKRCLAEEFGIDHATLEVECHECESDEVGH